MQTKVHFLRRIFYFKGERGGFALLTAVFLMLLISILLLKMLSHTADTTQRTVNEYLSEQAALLTYSATEYALLAISGQNRATSGCIQTISATYPSQTEPIFNIKTTIQYIWSNGIYTPADATCQGYIDGNQVALNRLDTNESSGAAVIEVVVTSDDSLHLDQPIRFYRKTLQKL